MMLQDLEAGDAGQPHVQHQQVDVSFSIIWSAASPVAARRTRKSRAEYRRSACRAFPRHRRRREGSSGCQAWGRQYDGPMILPWAVRGCLRSARRCSRRRLPGAAQRAASRATVADVLGAEVPARRTARSGAAAHAARRAASQPAAPSRSLPTDRRVHPAGLAQALIRSSSTWRIHTMSSSSAPAPAATSPRSAPRSWAKRSPSSKSRRRSAAPA